MSIDFGGLQVSKIIVHEIPEKSTEGNQQPRLSTVESTLTKDNKIYFTCKIKENLALASYEARFISDTESPIPQLVFNNFLDLNNNFVNNSRDIALYLYNCQTRVNSQGLLVVIQASIEENQALVILKLEKEEGVRINMIDQDDRFTYDIEYLRNIMMSEKNRVFKAALFVEKGKQIDEIEVYVSDSQRRKGSNSEIATFFLEKFLGCQLKEEPILTTKKFFNATESFINEQVQDLEHKAQYELALLSELKSEDRTVQPESFCEKHMRLIDRQKYINFLRREDVPIGVFDKDTKLIQSSLNKVQIELASGLTIVGSPESIKERLKINSTENGQAHIEIEDNVKKLKGK